MLPPSCDPGYANLAYQLTPGLLSEQGALFGYNTVPPIDLPNVIASTYPTAQQLTTTGQYGEPGVGYAAIGQQSVFATPLQNALVAAGVANGGLEMTPHVMAQIRDSQGNLVRSYQPTVWHRAVSQTAAQQVTTLMQAVATRGTAAGIFPASWNVAVKTGTAQIGNNQNEDWMIAFAPAVNPVIAVAVVLPYQAKASDGASVAGPVMKAVLGEALSLNSSTAAQTTTTTTTTSSGVAPRAATTTAPATPTTAAATTTTAPATTTTAPATTTTAPATTTTAATATTPSQ
jgi:penicillin-binding protein A